MTKSDKKEIAKKILEKYVEWDCKDRWDKHLLPFTSSSCLWELIKVEKDKVSKYLEREEEEWQYQNKTPRYRRL
jgi:hypothetical protein